MILNTHEIFKAQVINDAILHARETFPLECCGAVIGGEYVRFGNASSDPANEFIIDDATFDAAYTSGAVEAVIHSHNDCGHASYADMEQQQVVDVPYGIINMRGGAPLQVVFFGDGIPTEPLIGRPWFFGVWDCWTLVRDYFAHEFGRTGPNPPKEYGFWERGESVFEKYIESAPIRKISISSVKPGDLLFYRLSSTTKHYDHCGVMQDKSLVLHHFLNRQSARYPVSFQRQALRAAYRFDPDMEGWDD